MRLTLLVLLLILLGFTWWSTRNAVSPPAAKPQPGIQALSYFVKQLNLLSFDPDGAPLRRLQASELKQYLRHDNTYLKTPRFVLYADGVPLWKVASDKGQLSADESQLQLLGEVEIDRSANNDAPPLQINTMDLLVHTQQEYAETAAPVKVISEHNRIEAVGMQAWLRPPGRIRFLSNTRAYYAAQ